MDSWVWWVLTCGFALYFVLLLIEFNQPAQRLMGQIDQQRNRRDEMQQRLGRARDHMAERRARLDDLQRKWKDLEERRRGLLAQANANTMVLIPAGAFAMGGREPETPPQEKPVHTVYLAAYRMARFPVTNTEYREFIACTGHRLPLHWQRGTYLTGTGSHPVVNVSWVDAQAYAQWRGARLPTEAEWEKAARGNDERPYPWGAHFSQEGRCNCMSSVGTTTPVNEYAEGRSDYGIWDMSGNVYEWCADYYEKDYYRRSPPRNPKGPEQGQERSLRGGCFTDTRAAVKATARVGLPEHATRANVGFRLAADA